MSFQVSLGTITNVDEAVEWLSYTYLHIRMMVNPMVYGIPYGAREVSLMCILFKSCSDYFLSRKSLNHGRSLTVDRPFPRNRFEIPDSEDEMLTLYVIG